MLLLKGCKHCKGDLYLEGHVGEASELVCLQCGRRCLLKSSLPGSIAA